MKNLHIAGLSSVLCAVTVLALRAVPDKPLGTREDLLVSSTPIGHCGGQLVFSLRAEPKTLNPVSNIDTNSRTVIRLMSADLIHINSFTQRTEPALARSWSVSPDGRIYTIHLRQGLRFSDGYPFTSDDVVFTFQAHLDERSGSTQRDLLIIENKPITVRKLDEYTVRFELPQPYAAAERLFDGIVILPRHLLEPAYVAGQLSQAWGISTPPQQIAGLGPFRLKHLDSGQRVVLERNPYYWKTDTNNQRLPYLDRLVGLFLGNANAEILRFEAGETDVINRLTAGSFATLEKSQDSHGFRVYDIGPGLLFDFLFFNQNQLGSSASIELRRNQAWFRQMPFRQAISLALDRESLAQLAYRSHARPLWGPVTPGDKIWGNADLPHAPKSTDKARALLQSAGYTWNSGGRLLDPQGNLVKFSVIYNAGNPAQGEIAVLIQQDLNQIGISLGIVPLEFRSFLDRISRTYQYEAAIMTLASGDSDPNSEINVWISGGGAHFWNLTEKRPEAPWQIEVDQLMKRQMTTLQFARRRLLYNKVQQLIVDNAPIICLTSPDVLVGAKNSIGNFQPAILGESTLWNAEALFLRRGFNSGGK
jgi:peptide/nickel transport system substrate-binding protein